MRIGLRLPQASRVATLLAALCIGCDGGVAAVAPVGDAGGGDAAHPTEAGVPGAVDATACSDACGDGPTDATQAGDTPDAPPVDAPGVPDATDAGGLSDASDADTADADDAADEQVNSGPPVTHNESCHITWPQPTGYSSGGDAFGLVVDPAGNAYVAITYSSNPPSNPPIDLGVLSAGDTVGIAVAKLDPQCHLLWMREIGGPPGSSGTEITGSFAVDATSSVTIAGSFNGPVDFGAGTVNGYQVGYVLRFDASGNVVYSHTYPLDFPTLVGVESNGSAALLFYDYGAYECSLNPSFCDGGARAEAGASFYSFVLLDATGAETARNAFPGMPAVSGLGPATFTDLSLDPAGMIWAIDNYADAGPSLERLTTSGVPLWSQATNTTDLALGPAGGVVFAPDTTGPTEKFTLCGFDGGPSWNRSVPLGVSEPFFHDVGFDSTGNVYAAGQVWPRALPSGGPSWPSNVVGVEVLDPQGLPQGIRAWASGTNDYYRAFAVDPSGNAFIGGDFSDDDGGFSYFVVKLAP